MTRLRASRQALARSTITTAAAAEAVNPGPGSAAPPVDRPPGVAGTTTGITRAAPLAGLRAAQRRGLVTVETVIEAIAVMTTAMEETRTTAAAVLTRQAHRRQGLLPGIRPRRPRRHRLPTQVAMPHTVPTVLPREWVLHREWALRRVAYPLRLPELLLELLPACLMGSMPSFSSTLTLSHLHPLRLERLHRRRRHLPWTCRLHLLRELEDKRSLYPVPNL